MDAIRYTSIQHDGRNNYQSDFHGLILQVVHNFETECQRKGVIWAHLFEEKTGKIIAHYTKIQGFATTV